MSHSEVVLAICKWQSNIIRASIDYSKGVNPVNENKLTRKWHLASIKEWLDLAQAPLLKGQLAVAKALQELCQNHDTEGMVGGTDIAHAVNMGLSYVVHAQVLVEAYLTQLDTPSEPTLPSEAPKRPLLYCDSCERAFCADYGVEVGSDCPFCKDGAITSVPPRSKPAELPIDKDKDHGDEDSWLECAVCSAKFLKCTAFAVSDDCPECESGKIYPDGIPF